MLIFRFLSHFFKPHKFALELNYVGGIESVEENSRSRVWGFFKTLAFLIPGLFFPTLLWAQLKVDASISIQDAIQRLVGPGVRVSNVRVNCPSNGGRPYGYFTDNTGTLGISDGLILTTGSAANAIGPNNSASKSQDNGNDNQDLDLQSLITIDEKQFDACVVEFNVQVFADTLVFDYVFGSEEYLEFIQDYHDVFGFFISGPGILGKVNLATLPGTDIPISVKNINNFNNREYYIDNGTGATPFDQLFVQYDGFTKRLESKIGVIPCQTYALKLAICDVKDGAYDAGIFIAGKSLRTQAPKLSFRLEHNRFPSAIEGCNGLFLKIRRQSRISEPVVFELAYSGTATRNIDYQSAPDFVRFEAGESEKEVFISVLSDDLTDDRETLTVELLNPCPGLPPIDALTVPIRETFDFDLADTQICLGDTATLNPNAEEAYRYYWSPPAFLSCDSCSSPRTWPLATAIYQAKAVEKLSGCSAIDSLRVEVKPLPLAAFDFETNRNYTSLDVFFKNKSRFADRYQWSFGDGNGSGIPDPVHTYSPGFVDSVSYTIQLTAINSALGCRDSASAQVSLKNIFFIPNLILPNGDGKNDNFWIKGIEPGVWSLWIYDAWGKEVFYSSSYNLDWDASQAQSGTYFFLLQNPPKDRKFNGWLKVIK